MRGLWLVLMASCAGPERRDLPGPAPSITIEDVGRSSGYQDFWFGHYKRGRGSVVADFDGDGDPDLFSGNPGDESFLMRNITEPGGPIRFEPWQVLSQDELFYGGVSADFDGDGDPDLFVSVGANDGFAPDRVFRNDFGQGAPSDAPLVDVSDTLPLVPEMEDGTPVPNGTMGGRAFDANLDGKIDIFASNFAPFHYLDGILPADKLGLNQLYLNHGGLQFRERGWAVGLSTQNGSRHSAVFDFDRDGDMDIYENNFVGLGVFWENRLIPDGELSFQEATQRLSLGEGRNLGGAFLNQAMCSIPVDLDNDGWEDLLLLHRGKDGDSDLAIEGHQVFMNVGGTGFVDVLEHTNLQAGFEEHPVVEETAGGMGGGWGVMGCQVGDVNLDGFPDVFIGTGVGAAGDVDRLFVSSTREAVDIAGVGEVSVPMFDEWTDRIDFPADPIDGAPEVTYPYRTHGSSFADYDGDGIPELGVHNGGPAILSHIEPNRLWTFHHPDPRYLRLLLRGDGSVVNTDAIGARVKVVVERERDGGQWTLWQTRRAGTGFGAQNEPQLTFGMADADRVVEIEVHWPDGLVEQIEPPAGSQNSMVIER